MGLKIHISELDINCFGSEGNINNIPYNKEIERRLAYRYDQLFKLFRRNKDKIQSVTTWGIADDNTWLDFFYYNNGNYTYNANKPRKNYPLLFDENHKPKKALLEILEF